jgi:hypothetical protein
MPANLSLCRSRALGYYLGQRSPLKKKLICCSYTANISDILKGAN